MIYEEKNIIDVIEKSLFMSQGVEGIRIIYEHVYLEGTITPSVDHAEFNKVGMARIPEELVEKTIQEVLEDFQQYEVKTIGWVCSPQTEPSNLKEKLEVFGFVVEIPVWGMARSTEEVLDIEIAEEFEFKSYSGDEVLEIMRNNEFRRMGEKAYGAPEGAADVILLNLESSKNQDLELFIAFEKVEKKPVAYSAITYILGTDVARLSGAATLPEYRKKGIYSSMLKLRYDKAKENGIKYLIIQAYEATSAPIAAKFGFKKVCELPIYVWRS